MNSNKFVLLSIMMFLQYFIWGAWYVTMVNIYGTHLQSTGVQIGSAYGALAIATMISPFFVGMIADRFFAAQRIMGVLHLLGAALLFLATTIITMLLLLGDIILLVAVYAYDRFVKQHCFSQMTIPGKQFPWIRVFGTLGWIVAGLIIGGLKIEPTTYTFMIAAGVSAALGLLSFVLTQYATKRQSSYICIAGIGHGCICII